MLATLLFSSVLSAVPRAWSDAPLPPVLDPAAVDRAVDPCADFFQYSCGAWLKANPVPADQSRWYRFSLLDEHTRAVLRAILAQAAAEKNQTSPEARKLGDAYAACMDEPAIDAKGLAPLAPVLERIASLKDKSALPAEAARLHALGVGTLFSFGSAQDYTDARRQVAAADQGGFELPDRDYYLLDEFKKERADYLVHVERMFVLLGDAPKEAAAAAAVVLKVETLLAKAAMGRVERREPKNVHHKMPLAAFAQTTPAFSWKEYLAAAGAPAFSDLDVADPDFFKGLDAALAAVSLDDWKTLLRWDAVHGLAAMLPSKFVAEDFDFFSRRLGGQAELKARWKRCVGAVDGGMGEALGKAYVATEFPPQAKARAVAMVRDIKREMVLDIHRLSWMSEETKTKALGKLDRLADKIGYPDAWRDYSGLAIAPGDALGNLERAAAFEVRRQLAKIGKPVDRGEWYMTPPTDNAYYDPQMNDINFPAGILQPPNFDLAADTAAVLGAIGATVGHELTHGFDDEGRHYDAEGNMADWWTEADAVAFEARAQAFVDEYSGFTAVGDVKLNGRLTLGENIADNGGLVLAYMALVDSLQASPAKPLDGFDPRQRFFISYAQSWCLNQTDASAREAAKVDPHSPGRWRVNGVVANMPEFAAAFSCTPGTAMAPAKANRVW